MKKIDLNRIAEEFEMINDDTHLFYNLETGEFDFYGDYMELDDRDSKKFEDDVWIAAPSQRDLGEYDIMAEFADSITDSHANELLCVALEGKGAFRRFKDVLHSTGLADEWYSFKHNAYVKIARNWCEENDIECLNTLDMSKQKANQFECVRPEKIAVSMATLESHNHIVGDIERGVKVFKSGKVEFEEREPNFYWAKVPHKGDFKLVTVSFSRDGEDLNKHFCDCTWQDKRPPVCRHVVAAVLAIQGGQTESKLSLSKTTSVNTIVNESNTAFAMQSGSLPVFSTPSMIALMECAACKCLADCLDDGQTSVGTMINVEHTAATSIGAEITATATIEYVLGRKIEFAVTASDSSGIIGKGKHTRMIVDAERFMDKFKAQTI